MVLEESNSILLFFPFTAFLDSEAELLSLQRKEKIINSRAQEYF